MPDSKKPKCSEIFHWTSKRLDRVRGGARQGSEMFRSFGTDSWIFGNVRKFSDGLCPFPKTSASWRSPRVPGSTNEDEPTVPPQDSNPRLGCAAKPSRAINGAASGADSLLGDFGCYLFCADWGALEVPLRCPWGTQKVPFWPWPRLGATHSRSPKVPWKGLSGLPTLCCHWRLWNFSIAATDQVCGNFRKFSDWLWTLSIAATDQVCGNFRIKSGIFQRLPLIDKDSQMSRLCCRVPTKCSDCQSM